MSICSLSSTGVDQVFWASLFATGMASTPESSYQVVSADSTSLSLPRFKFRFCEKGSQPTAEAKKAEGAVRTADGIGIPIPPNFTSRSTFLSRDSLRLTLQRSSRDAGRYLSMRCSLWQSLKHGEVRRTYNSLGIWSQFLIKNRA